MMKRFWGLAVATMFAFSVAPIGAPKADTLDELKKRGEMIVGMEAAYQPYEYFKDGKIVGYDVDIIDKLAEKLGVKVKLMDTAWNGIIPALYASKFDLIWSGMTITKERAEKVLFSMPYSEAGTVVMKRLGDDSIKDAADLSGKNVGTQLGSAGSVLAQKFQDKLKESGKPGFADYKLYEHYPESYMDLTNRRIDGVIASRAVISVVMKEQPGRFAWVGGLQQIKAYSGVAMRKEDEALAKEVNDLLAKMKADGSLAALQTKWFGETFDTPSTMPTFE